ncbi:MAG: hypothetical protein ABSF85_00825 [Terriglobales bacterium]
MLPPAEAELVKSASSIVVTPSNETDRNTWDRLPSESSKAFDAFVQYRQMGMERSVQKVVQKLTKSRQLLHRWAQVHNWKRRAEDFDSYQDEIAQRETIRQRIEFNKATLAIAQKMQAKALQGFNALETVKMVQIPRKEIVDGVEKITGYDTVQELAVKPGELIKILEVACTLQKEVLGKSTDDHVAKIEVIFEAPEYDCPQPGDNYVFPEDKTPGKKPQ